MDVTYLFDCKVVNEVVIVFIQVTVQRHAVALVKQVLQCVHPLHTQRALRPVLQVWVIKDNIEAKHLGPHSHCLSYTTCERNITGRGGVS